jgi:host factor-I protein
VAKEVKVYDKFVGSLIENKTAVVIFLINGVKLQGVIDDFDEVSVVLKRDQYVQLLYRHAISTIVPQYRYDG